MFEKIGSKIRGWDEKNRKREEATIEALCEHLRQIGLEPMLVAFKEKPTIGGWVENGRVLGAVRITNRNINLIEFVEWWGSGDSDGASMSLGYGCSYLVQIRIDGSEDKMKVESWPVRKGFLSREILAFKWKEKTSESWSLARDLNNDSTLRDMLYPKDKLALNDVRIGSKLPPVEIKPYRKHQCVRIRQRSFAKSPAEALPTIETFDALDRIAHHIRNIANVL